MKRKTNTQKGIEAEQEAREYLEGLGLQFLESRFTTRNGEVDLVMFDELKGELVFIEVRSRHNSKVEWHEMISQEKIERVKCAASVFLARARLNGVSGIRFDLMLRRGKSWTHMPDAW